MFSSSVISFSDNGGTDSSTALLLGFLIDVPIERQIHLLQGFDYIAKNMKRGLGEIWYNGFRFYRDSL